MLICTWNLLIIILSSHHNLLFSIIFCSLTPHLILLCWHCLGILCLIQCRADNLRASALCNLANRTLKILKLWLFSLSLHLRMQLSHLCLDLSHEVFKLINALSIVFTSKFTIFAYLLLQFDRFLNRTNIRFLNLSGLLLHPDAFLHK